MAIKTCRCGKEFEDMGFKTLCPSCYSRSNGRSRINVDKDTEIRRQVCLKVAGHQLEKATAQEVVNYARDLEKEFNLW